MASGGDAPGAFDRHLREILEGQRAGEGIALQEVTAEFVKEGGMIS